MRFPNIKEFHLGRYNAFERTLNIKYSRFSFQPTFYQSFKLWIKPPFEKSVISYLAKYPTYNMIFDAMSLKKDLNVVLMKHTAKELIASRHVLIQMESSVHQRTNVFHHERKAVTANPIISWTKKMLVYSMMTVMTMKIRLRLKFKKSSDKLKNCRTLESHFQPLLLLRPWHKRQPQRQNQPQHQPQPQHQSQQPQPKSLLQLQLLMLINAKVRAMRITLFIILNNLLTFEFLYSKNTQLAGNLLVDELFWYPLEIEIIIHFSTTAQVEILTSHLSMASASISKADANMTWSQQFAQTEIS